MNKKQTSGTKRCPKCKERKPIKKFSQYSDGRPISWCMACTAKSVRDRTYGKRSTAEINRMHRERAPKVRTLSRREIKELENIYQPPIGRKEPMYITCEVA